MNALFDYLPLADIKNQIINGDSSLILSQFPEESISLSFWSPPYHVGKKYETGQSFEDWQALLREVIYAHNRILKPGAFLVVNINDILCFKDANIPHFQADLTDRKKVKITREEILKIKNKYPQISRYELAKLCGCSEQTIQRRLENNNVRGGKQEIMTKVKLTGSLLQEWAEKAGIFLYDRRIWMKDPTWENSKWHSSSYRSVDEFEYLYIFWKPGITQIKRSRLSNEEWGKWGSRGVWVLPSIRANIRHEAEFPELLAERIIRLFSDPGDFVLDPFCGSGTTCFVAQKLGRNWCGIDSSKEYCDIARMRINE